MSNNDSIAAKVADFAYSLAFENGFSNSQLMRLKNSVESIVSTIEKERAGAEDARKLGNAIRDYVEKYHELTISFDDCDGYQAVVINDFCDLDLESSDGIISLAYIKNDDEDDDWECWEC